MLLPGPPLPALLQADLPSQGAMVTVRRRSPMFPQLNLQVSGLR